MAVTKTSFEWTASSSLTQTVPFEVISAADIDVYVEGVLQLQQNTTSTADATHPQVISGEITQGTALTNYTVASNNGSITFNANLTVGDFVVIERTTDDTLLETFTSGSTIRARDLNSAFERVLFIAQEGVSIANEALAPADDEDDALDAKGERISNVADAEDDDDAVNRAQLGRVITDDLIEGEGIDFTDVDGGTNSGKQVTISAELSTASNPGVVQINATTPITATYSNPGELELSIADNSIDLEKIKDEDIITSAETWNSSDTQVATTQAIDDYVDTAITNDISVDGTGLTLTDDGDGTITLGIGAGAVDLDRINAGNIINLAEQNLGTPAPADTSIFTSSAAAKRFDTLVQTGTPSGSDYQVGKTWLQNDDDLTLSIWNGSGWTAVSSGGTFTEQPNVVYVDKASGDDANTGHRISTPKATIKAAINQINAEIGTEITSGGSGYVNGSYTNVPLTGGSSTGLQANITVAGGVVTAVTVTSTATLENYSIGDVLSANNANLGGSGTGLQITVNGDGDGQIVVVSAGVYQEVAPIQIKRRNVSVIGQALRSCLVHPTEPTQGDDSAGNHALFELNSGSYIANLTLTGMQANTGTGNAADTTLPTNQGWNFKFYSGATITKSPYIQNCTNFSDAQIDNNNLNAHNPAGGAAGDTDSTNPTGGGLFVDGTAVADASPLRSMVCDSYTHVGLNGPGILVTNNGYVQATSSYAFFNKYHIKTLNGGQANLAASTTDFGDQALVADGKSVDNIFTADCVTQANVNDTTIEVSNGVADASWHGTKTRPATNMLLAVNSEAQIYPILGAVPTDTATYNADPDAYTGNWTVTISRPDPNNKSSNLGFSAQVSTGTNNVQFFLRSMIASSGHTMEYVGSGTDYTALPENGGVPDETKQITESNNGKVWTAITDHNGKFKIGGNQTDDPIFQVDQQLGFVTIPEGSISFNLLSDLTPQLGGNLDLNGFTITDDTDSSINGIVTKTGDNASASLPVGTTAQRDASPAAGLIRYNSTLGQFEGYTSTWGAIGGGATGGGSDTWAVEHDNTITTSYTIGTNKNVISAGPLTINALEADGVTPVVITVPSGSNWVIV